MIERLQFGKTGHQSSRTILGAAAFGKVSQAEVDKTMEVALAYGVNHVDTAASYGHSEEKLGDWIGRHGKPFFLATKTGERERQGAWQSIQRSLELLRVEQLDLIQLHNLVEPNEWDRALGPGGALEALIEARAQGLVRFIGVTGHGLKAPAQHLRALDRFAFDSVLFPFNFEISRNAEYFRDAQALIAVCRERQVAMQTIKSLVRAPWGDRTATNATWYEPLQTPEEISLAVGWVLGHPGLFLNTVGDVQLIPTVLEAAKTCPPAPGEAEMLRQRARLATKPLFTTDFLL